MKPGFMKKVKDKLSQLCLPYRRSKKNKFNNEIGDNNNNFEERKFDVFIGYTGDDTRRNFNTHLFEALSQQHIKTFVDDNLTGGDEIPSAVLRAIEESKISFVIFSEDYASCKRFLRTVAEIMRCKRMYGQIVIPVFDNVDRSHVQEQTGSFMDSFAKHEQVESQQELQAWRDALTEASGFHGWDRSVTKPDTELVDEIVEDVLRKLPFISDSKGPIGIDSGDGGSRGSGSDGEGGGGGGDADSDNDGGDNTECSGEMGPETGDEEETDFRFYSCTR